MSEIDEESIARNAPQFQGKDGQWYCGECSQQINEHLPTCETHKAFKKWFRKVTSGNRNYVKPDWMCPGCDAKKEGPHRFSCCVGGARATQVILPATRSEDGKFTVHLPGESKKT